MHPFPPEKSVSESHIYRFALGTTAISFPVMSLSIHDEFHGFSTPRIVQARGTAHRTLPAVATQAASVIQYSAQPAMLQCINTWWLIPLSKWVITPVLSGLTLLIPFITGVITHLLSGMSHQV